MVTSEASGLTRSDIETARRGIVSDLFGGVRPAIWAGLGVDRASESGRHGRGMLQGRAVAGTFMEHLEASLLVSLKSVARTILSKTHATLLNAPASIGRLWTAAVIDPPKILTVPIEGTACRFIVKSNYTRYYYRHLATLSTEGITRQTLALRVGHQDVLAYIGANVGVYAIWAALHCHPKAVIAFEPEPENYELLVANIRANGAYAITPMPLAVGGAAGYDTFYQQTIGAGSASAFMADYINATPDRAYDGAILVRVDTIDSLIAADVMPAPTVALIDVDGGEIGVLDGMMTALDTMHTVIIEVDSDTEAPVHDRLSGLGFTLVHGREGSRRNAVYAKDKNRP